MPAGNYMAYKIGAAYTMPLQEKKEWQSYIGCSFAQFILTDKEGLEKMINGRGIRTSLSRKCIACKATGNLICERGALMSTLQSRTWMGKATKCWLYYISSEKSHCPWQGRVLRALSSLFFTLLKCIGTYNLTVVVWTFEVYHYKLHV